MMINPYLFGGFVATAPVNITPPTLAGKVFAGQTLTITPGTWTGAPAPTYGYQFLADGVAIPGEVGLTYLVTFATENKIITAIEAATNVGGTNSVATNSLQQKRMTDYANLALYLSGADTASFTLDSITTPGTDKITQWRDKSGLNRHLNPLDFILDTANPINGRPAPYLNGTTAFGVLDAALLGINNSASMTLIFTAKADGPNAADRVLLGGQNGGATVVLAMQQRTVGPGVRFRASNASSNSADTALALGTAPRVWMLRKDAGTVRAYLNNTVLNTAPAGNVMMTRLELGRFLGFPARLWKGHIMDAAIYTDTKTIAESNDIRADILNPLWGTSATPI